MNSTWVVGGVGFLATFAAGMLLYPRDDKAAEPASSERASPPPSTPAPGEQINIPSLGLSVVRPSSWSTITAEENAKNIRSVQMDDAQLQELAARYAAAPIVAMTKYKEPYDDLNPSFKINVRALGGFTGHAPEEILLAAIPTMRRMFGDLTIDAAPTRTTVSGKPAAYTRLSYKMRAGKSTFPTVSEVWVVPSGPIFFMIGTGTRADERNGSRAEVRKIVDSIAIR
jgi:hypothetical protein